MPQASLYCAKWRIESAYHLQEFHGITPSQATNKGAVFSIFPKLSFQIPDLNLDVSYKRGANKMAVLGKMEFFNLPPVRMIGIEVTHGYDCGNPVPELWENCFKQSTLKILETLSPELNYYIGWMGDYDNKTKRFSYIAGYFMPVNTPVPEGFQYRDLSACRVGMGYINGSFDDVFPRLHDLTVGGIQANGYEPDYTQNWSAEVYATDLSFEANEGTINYICPCKVVQTRLM